MTRSEQICNDLGAKFFCKDYVFENLNYFNDHGNKVELCDGLFAFGDFYVAIQIKERVENNGRSDENWLKKVVYEKAVNQVVETVKTIKTVQLKVNDKYHQSVDLNRSNIIFPIVVFENDSITDYTKTIQVNDVRINVFSLSDYRVMLETLMHPYDIVCYLEERFCWINKCNGHLPFFVLGEGEKTTIISRIKNEKDFSNFFSQYIYDGDKKARDDSLRILAIINSFREKQIKKCPDYKCILNLLQLIRPQMASAFIDRFKYSWDSACKNIFDYSKAIQLIVDNKKTSIVFCSVGTSPFEDKGIYTMICDAKQQQQHVDRILLIAFVGDNNNTCQIDWVYFEKPFIEEPEILIEYIKMGILSENPQFGDSFSENNNSK